MNITTDISRVVIDTGRLTLRAFVQSDLADFYAYASAPGVGEMAGWHHHESIETSEIILRLFIEGKNVCAIHHKEANRVIGSLGFHDSWANEDKVYSHLKAKEIGYVLAKDFWGHGLMPEAVKAIIDYGFNELGIEAITCGHFLENNQSKRVIEKIGFEFVKQSEYYSKQMNKTFEDMKYILLKEVFNRR